PAESEEEKKKTLKPEEFSSSATILDRWKEFINSDKIKNELKLSALEYGVPSEVKDNEIEIRFDPIHIVLHNFCEAKKDELEIALNEFYRSPNYKIKLVVEKVDDKDRIIKIKKNTARSFEEKKDELLKKSPKLKFLFEEPFNCRFID
ncbi:MAG: hypothetical protein JXN63_02635, partial [Candidatus Delongbacteria bacterium]|nr:hypothetical protein [Candidatus Delongbacteria bacterium]